MTGASASSTAGTVAASRTTPLRHGPGATASYATARVESAAGRRLAGTDGVSLEAEKWADILREQGATCFYFAGELGMNRVWTIGFIPILAGGGLLLFVVLSRRLAPAPDGGS